MIDVNILRNNPEVVREALMKRGRDATLVDQWLKVDEEWRMVTTKVGELRAQLNKFSKERAVERAKEVKTQIKACEVEVARFELEREQLLQQFPNIPASHVPVGKSEADNVVLREVGVRPQFDFDPKDYLTIAEALGVIDVKSAALVAGSRFGYLKGQAALLELALIQFCVQHLVKKGFAPIIPPVMIRPQVFAAMGRLAADQKDERYYIPTDDIYLVGSAEHTTGPLHMNETLRDKDLPKRYVAFSTCFRREAGSYGKDTKGILRVHQFDKVEMFSFCAPEKSEEEHQFLLSCQEEIMKALALPYRVVQICTGDMGWTDAGQYDIETWLPGQPSIRGGQEKGLYRETNSCSNTTDFQARGINCKYDKGGYVHMLNATACAIGRTIIAIIENNQKPDGTFEIPKALSVFCRGD